MRPRLTAVFGGLTLLLGLLVLSDPAATAAPPEHTLAVSGAGVTTYPAFDPGTERYAVAGAEGGELRVRASTTDADGQVLIDGVPRGASADVVVTGAPGEEVSVIFDDADGRVAHSFFLLPDGFPRLEAETTGGAELEPGWVLLTLSQWSGGAPFFETAVDRNGVPVHVHEEASGSLDLKRQPNGSLTTQRSSAGNDRTGSPVVVLDEGWQPTGEMRRTVDLVNTDSHDSILTEDGRTILLAYERRTDGDGVWQDAVVQELDADGKEVFTWRTGDDEVEHDSVTNYKADYAHINSVVEMADGNWLLSFRNFSSVWKVDSETGDVLWKLGGRRSDFTFNDDEHAGPCAQHTASELPNGNVLIFDNGSGQLGDTPTNCVDPDDPDGELIDRTFTRISEYQLDEQTMEANLVSEYAPGDPMDPEDPVRFAYFAGGVAQLPSGHRLIGWAASRVEIATELDIDGQTPLWTLRDPNPDVAQRLFTYRAHVAEVPDVIEPEVTVADPGELVQGTDARLDWQCRDRGGSGLDTCTVTGDGVLDTSELGEHSATVTATDGAGNTTTKEATYVVAPIEHTVDAAVRVAETLWKGVGVVGKAKKQQVATKVNKVQRKRVAKVRITNRGNVPGRFLVTGKGTTKVVKVVHRHAGRKISGKVTGSGFRTPVLAPGASMKVKVAFKRKRAVKRNQRFRVRVHSTADASARDTVRVKVKVRR